MAILKFNSAENDRFEAFLDGLPDVSELDPAGLQQCREEITEMIRQLDAIEPRNEQSEEYEDWGDLHEALEDALDEVLDTLEEI